MDTTRAEQFTRAAHTAVAITTDVVHTATAFTSTVKAGAQSLDVLAGIVAAGGSLVSPARRQFIDDLLRKRLGSLTVAVESPTDIHNALAIVRTAESLGISTIHLIHPENERIRARRITQGAFKWIHIVEHTSTHNFVANMREQKFKLAGTVPPEKAFKIGVNETPLTLEQVPVDHPLCVLLGNEHKGLSPDAIAACDFTFTIAMFGATESLNLSVAAGMCLFELAKRRRSFIHTIGDLTDAQRSHLESLLLARC